MEKYSIKDLQQRYGLKTRQSVYDRLNAIKAEVLKEGNKSYVTEDAIIILDQLQEHLKLGGSIKTFTPTVITTVQPEIDSVNSQIDNLTVNSKTDSVDSQLDSSTVNSQTDSVDSQIDTQVESVQLSLFSDWMEKTVEKVVEKAIPSNPITDWEKLDQAVERGYS